MTDYITAIELKTIHMRVGALGGDAGELRDQGALDAAAERPKSDCYANLHEKVAALIEALVMGEPFTRLNVRTALAAADVFLRINGRRLVIDPSEGYLFVNARFFRREFTIDHIAPWLEERIAHLD